MSPMNSKPIQLQLLTNAALLFVLSTPYQHSKPIQLQVQPEKDGDRSAPEAIKSTQATQQPSEETYELTDAQLQSVVGGLQERKIIRIIGFEN